MVWSLFLTTSKKFYVNTKKETNHEIKTNKKVTFPLACDIDGVKFSFVNVE